MPDGQLISDVSSLYGKIKDLGLNEVKMISGNTACVPVLFTNKGIHTSFELKEIGIFALDPDEGEICLLYTSTDLSFYLKVRDLSTKPVILAGGITPENVFKILERTNAGYIDIMTGIEEVPGVKDENKVQKLFEELRKFRGV